MNEKQQQLLFDKGITNVPSDALCSDNALEESLGMVYDNGEHRVIQEPVLQMGIADSHATATMLYVHNFNGNKRYIYAKSIRGSSNSLYWGVKEDDTLSDGESFTGLDVTDIDKVHVTSVGKTLIVVDPNGFHYYLWKDGSYRELGPIPVPQPEYKMCTFEANAEPKTVVNPPFIGISQRPQPKPEMFEYAYIERKDIVKHTLSHQAAFKTDGFNGAIEPADDKTAWQEKHQEEYNDLVMGCYSANKKAVALNKCFCNPFFVRVALELYDGSFYHVGAPMLMLPAVYANSWARISTGYNFTLYTICRQLVVKQKTDYTDWSDIVKDVVLFVTDDVEVNETTMDIPIFEKNGTFCVKGYYAESLNEEMSLKTIDQTTPYSPGNCKIGNYNEFAQKHDNPLIYHYNPFKSRENSDINNSITGMSIFYKLCSIGIKEINEWTSTREKIEKHTLENITTQDQLQYDDYFSACPLKCSSIFTYNGRINLAGVQRGFFEGFDFDKAYSVGIDINDSTKTISHTNTISTKCFYFFYPDPRAKTVTFNGVTKELKEHPGLNGAYYFAGIENVNNSNTSSSGGTGQASSGTFIGDFESLPNTLITSEVNNPFVFYAHGYNNVGTGSVIGISSVTQALSEGQFGQYPLIVFASDGVWAMNVNSEGLYSSVQPISREVCNNTKSITQTDGAVFFSSEKGLMVVVGSQVKCVSEQLSGKNNSFIVNNDERIVDLGNFQDYIKECFIAYDYRDSMLWIFNTNYTYCWVYSIKSGTFGKYNYTCNFVVNDYPDYLTSNSTTFLSFADRPNINVDNKSGGYSGLIISRPMKLENALALKSIMQVRHIHDIENLNKDGQGNPTLAFKLYGSNNLMDWVQLQSLRGVPWRYYRFEYDFAGLKATDRFAGTMIVTQERRTDKLR